MGVYEDTQMFADLEIKVAPAPADMLQIADSEDGGRVRKIPFSALQNNTDGAAIHDNTAGEIHAITNKSLPELADEVVGETSTAGAWTKIRISIGNFFKTVGWIDNLTAKTAPVPADTAAVGDSAASGAPKKSTLAQIFAAVGSLTPKASPVAADGLLVLDSAASGVAKTSTVGALPIAQAQVRKILLRPAANAAVEILPTTGAVELEITDATNNAITTNASCYRGQEVSFRCKAASGGGSYTLDLGGTNLTINATGEAPRVIRSETDTWVVMGLEGATIV